jgi:hypothetical protein
MKEKKKSQKQKQKQIFSPFKIKILANICKVKFNQTKKLLTK